MFKIDPEEAPMMHHCGDGTKVRVSDSNKGILVQIRG